jgi:hypothetical protein
MTGSRAVLSAQNVGMAESAEAVESSRVFFLRGIDDASGETQGWRERCSSVEEQAAAEARAN